MKTGKLARMAAAAFAVAAISGCGDRKADEAEVKGDDAITVIATRTSVRSYDAGREVDEATIEKLLRAGMAAPTARNTQPWEFIVVKDREQLKAIAQVHPHSQMSAGAGCAIIVCGTDNGMEGPGKEYWVQACSAATENILLAAHALGLGAVWCGVYPIPERIAGIKGVMGIPDGVTPLNVINIGHIKAPSKPKDKWKPEKVHRDRW